MQIKIEIGFLWVFEITMFIWRDDTLSIIIICNNK